MVEARIKDDTISFDEMVNEGACRLIPPERAEDMGHERTNFDLYLQTLASSKRGKKELWQIKKRIKRQLEEEEHDASEEEEEHDASEEEEEHDASEAYREEVDESDNADEFD
jgi:hypothetical protein